MAAVAILKITKIAISHQRIDRSSRNLARLCQMGLITVQMVKKIEFQKSKMGTAAILKTVKSPSRQPFWPILVKFGTVTHIGPLQRPTAKFWNFWKTKMAMFDVPLAHSLKLACFRYFASVAKEQTRLKSWRGPQLGWIKIPFLFLFHLSPSPTIVPPLFYLPSLFLFPLPVQYAYGLGGLMGCPRCPAKKTRGPNTLGPQFLQSWRERVVPATAGSHRATAPMFTRTTNAFVAKRT